MVFLRTVTAVLGAAFAITVCGAEMPVAEAESVGMSTERLQRIDTAMQRHIHAGKIQGAVTALARRGKVVHFKAHGLMDVGAERPMSRDAIFIMMSSTKAVLGVAAMMMVEEGLIRPSDPVGKYIPELADMQVAVLKDPADEDISPLKVDRRTLPAHRLVPAKTPITIHHLLTHTSGFLWPVEHGEGLSPLPADAHQRRRTLRSSPAQPAYRHDDDQRPCEPSIPPRQKGGSRERRRLYRRRRTRPDCGGQPAQCRGIRFWRRVRHRVLVGPGRGNRRRHHAAATLRARDL